MPIQPGIWLVFHVFLASEHATSADIATLAIRFGLSDCLTAVIAWAVPELELAIQEVAWRGQCQFEPELEPAFHAVWPSLV